MKAFALAALSGLVAASAGCLGPRPEPPRLPDPACHPMGGHFAFLDTDTRIFRQGATIRLTPRVNAAPGGSPEIPLRCTSDWSVAGPATLGADRTILTIAPDAPVGSTVSVSFRRGGEAVAGRFRVIGRDEIVLTGARSQKAIEGCSGVDPVGELEFSGENRFSVTFTPFESYRDYWGTYSFDPSTKRLTMTVDGGNYVPAALDLEGTADLGPGGLVLSGMYFGTRGGFEAPHTCTYRF
ncbi:MAG TPA: hypothetical protein VF577_01190 [Allosphingosinicella sp.]|jgi:hypothetical protein